MKFSFIEEVAHDSKLSSPMLMVLHGALLVLLAWNIAILPRVANDFADAVHRINHERASEMGEYSSISNP
jgi:hypothetical protein